MERDRKLVTIMLVVNQVLNVGGNTLCKAAMARGMSNFVFIAYTHFLALLLLIPSAFLYHRTTPLPLITFNIILRLFLLGFISYCCSIFLYIGISYSSPTLASAMTNLSPALTFTLAVVFGLLKIIGAVISVVGAFIMIFYQGLPIAFWSPAPSMFTFHSITASELTNWIIGGILLVISSIFLSLIYIIKTWIVRGFHSDVMVAVIFIFFETNLATMIALIAEKGSSVWIPSSSVELIAILFGALEVGVINVVHTWACRKKGPVFAVIFKPLQLIIAAIMRIFFLSETLHLGSVIGGGTIAIGFYSVLRGKLEEEMVKDGGESGIGSDSSESFSHTICLLLENS